MQVKIISYTGDGTSNRSIGGVGFQPDCVIVKAMSGSGDHYFRTKDMGANASLRMRGDGASIVDGIRTLNSDGFTINHDSNVNANLVTYTAICIKEGAEADFKTFFYQGDDLDGKTITGIGFQPDFVVIKSDDTITGAYRFSTKTVSPFTSMMFGGGNRSDLIETLSSDGFVVNNGSGSGANLVNRNTKWHYGFCFKKVTGFLEVFTITGNSTDNRNITIPNTSFQPSWVWIKGENSAEPRLRTSSSSGDNSWNMDQIQGANYIQAINTDGFQVGTDIGVNNNTTVYHILAIKEGTTASGVTLKSATDTGSGAEAVAVVASLTVQENVGRQFILNETLVDPPSAGTLGGNATHDNVNNYVRLTTAINSQNGYYAFPPQALPTDFTLESDIWAGGGNGADGFCFYFGTTTDSGNEEDADGGYRIYASEYNDVLAIRFNGAIITSISQTDIDNSTWRVFKVVKTGNNFKVYLDDVLKMDYTDTTRTLGGSKYGFGARTGGLNNEHRIRNLKLYTGATNADALLVTQLYSLTDASIATEAQSIIAALTQADNSTGVDSIAVDAGATLKNIADTGIGNDSVANLLASFSRSEQGTSAEVVSILNAFQLPDTATGTDVVAILTTIALSDTGASIEALTLLAQITRSESGSSVEALNALISVALSESATGADARQILTTLATADNGTGSDTANALIAITTSDSGASAEVLSLLGQIALSDIGSSQDALSALITIALSENSTTQEAMAILRDLVLADSGVTIDMASALISIIKADSGTSSEALSLFINLSLSENVISSELVFVVIAVALADTTIGSDIVTVLTTIALSDTGSSEDALTTLAQLALVDSATSTEALSTLVLVALSESTLANEALTILYYVALSDAGIAAEVVERAVEGGLFIRGEGLYNGTGTLRIARGSLTDKGAILYNRVLGGLYNKK